MNHITQNPETSKREEQLTSTIIHD